MQKEISPLIVGGQGTYRHGHYYTEYPDRDLAIQHAAATRDVVAENFFTHVVISGGFTQRQTPDLSEAQSFENMWNETQSRPRASVVRDEVALDSAENVIYGLMALRLDEPSAVIRRIGFYSLWQFKKPRMTQAASMLGIVDQFFFYAFASAELANAGKLAQSGEDGQLAKMAASQDYLLLGSDWEEKRRLRFGLKRDDRGEVQISDDYRRRDAHLREAFPRVFAALDSLRKTTLVEVQEYHDASPDSDAADAISRIRQEKLGKLREAFGRDVVGLA